MIDFKKGINVLFQFQKGAIKSLGKKFPFPLRLQFQFQKGAIKSFNF